MSIAIKGTGIGLPARHVSNAELAALAGLDTSDEWIQSRTGIAHRYFCTDETLTDLATTAARAALADSGLDITDVDYLVCATLGGDTRTPSLACAVAERLGLTCAALDVNAACAGAIYALDLAASLIQAGRVRHVLVVGAEELSAHMDFTDRGTCVLFGDAAGACVVGPGHGLTYINLRTVPDTRVITMRNRVGGNSPVSLVKAPPGFLEMDGQKVFKYAVSLVEQEVQRALETLGLTPDAIDHYILHQANRRIIESARQRLGLPSERFGVNIDRYGNTSAASVLLVLHEMLADHRISQGQRLLLCAFGAGMTCGTCVLEWE